MKAIISPRCEQCEKLNIFEINSEEDNIAYRGEIGCECGNEYTIVIMIKDGYVSFMPEFVIREMGSFIVEEV